MVFMGLSDLLFSRIFRNQSRKKLLESYRKKYVLNRSTPIYIIYNTKYTQRTQTNITQVRV